MNVGFIGMGRMGVGMAANLLKAGHSVTVYNRTSGKTAELEKLGAKVAASVAETCRNDAVITMLANDEAVETVTLGNEGIVQNLPKGAMHISSSTIGMALSERMTDAHARQQQRFVSAPVFGRPDAAAAGKLNIVVGGDPAAIQSATPLLDAMGQKTYILSDQPKGANLVKLSGNFLIGSVIESLGEALALVGKGGVDKGKFMEMLTSSIFNAPVYKVYGGLVAGGVFEPAGFAAPLGQKDVRLILSAAESLNVPMPIASLLRDRFLALLAQGGAHLDWSAISTLAAKDAGAVSTA